MNIIPYLIPSLLGAIGFVCSIAVRALIKMGKDINEIKHMVRETSLKHDYLEKRVEKLELFTYEKN